MKWLWTWGGTSFGYRSGDDLWTHAGCHVGRFLGTEIFAPSGDYLGEIKSTNRLITDLTKHNRYQIGFTPSANRAGYAPYADYAAYVMYIGYRDFPSPSTLHRNNPGLASNRG